MTDPSLAIEVHNLVRRFGRTDAVNGLNLRVGLKAFLKAA